MGFVLPLLFWESEAKMFSEFIALSIPDNPGDTILECKKERNDDSKAGAY